MDFGRESGNETVMHQLVRDYREADLDPADRALCDYAVKLTVAPQRANAGDLDTLRSHGLTDDEITIAIQVISYFNYINRVADGLGVDDEKGMTPPKDAWLSTKGRGYG